MLHIQNTIFSPVSVSDVCLQRPLKSISIYPVLSIWKSLKTHHICHDPNELYLLNPLLWLSFPEVGLAHAAKIGQ